MLRAKVNHSGTYIFRHSVCGYDALYTEPRRSRKLFSCPKENMATPLTSANCLAQAPAARPPSEKRRKTRITRINQINQINRVILIRALEAISYHYRPITS